MTQTNKVLKRHLVLQRWDADDELWWRPGRELSFRRFTADDAADLAERFAAHGRANVLV
jgi:fatty-acyl-CoA synthase